MYLVNIIKYLILLIISIEYSDNINVILPLQIFSE